MNELLVDGKSIEIVNPDKILWEDEGVTKKDYITYLLEVSPYLIQHTMERLLMIWMYPHGINSMKIEKRSVPEQAPIWVSSKFYKNKKRILLNDRATLIWAANYGALEFHVPFDRYDKPGYPLEIAFDLDPPDTDSFHLVLDVSIRLKQLLDSLGLLSVPRTSGSSGMQIFVPIQPIYTFEETRKINTFIAHYFAEQFPKQITLERTVSKRGNKLYFDYLQLWKGRTMPAVYSARAKPGATVATPLTWDEVEIGITPANFTILNMTKRIQEKGDLFKVITSAKQNQSLEEILRFIKKKEI
ncbi:non-homologous end-joining DNA ligase [Mesobacillus jeotgali]|uniref:non-homologous end-joining DNA ligase n=1 Tax=Mesobacillus jeotgali TaxID=129985 RepID=UPI002149480A|nr:non-homologous end-joining DNA ligase [Mesobacillus jeotgali]